MKNEGIGVNGPRPNGRKLVPVEPPAAVPATVAARPLAAFLAQLLASHARLAMFRVRRRADPKEAHALYARDTRPPPRPRFERKL